MAGDGKGVVGEVRGGEGEEVEEVERQGTEWGAMGWDGMG